MPGNTKLALGVCHPYDTVSHMSTISIFFESSYMSLSLFFPPFRMMLVGSLKNIPEFFEPPKFLFMLKIFCFCNAFIALCAAASVFCSSPSFLSRKKTLHLL